MNPTPDPHETVREAHLRDYWKVVWQARWTVAAVFLVVVGLAAVWTFMQTPIYRATAVIEVQPQANRVAAGRDVSGLGVAGYGWFAEEKYHNTQVEILQSRDVAARVVESLNLVSAPEFEGSSDPVEAFRRRVRAVPRRDTGLIEVSIAGADPDRITQWVNEVARLYVDRNLQKAKENVNRALDTIKGEMQTFKNDFADAEQKRLSKLRASPLRSEERAEIVRDKIKAYTTELTALQIELNELRDTLTQIDELRSGGGDLMSIPRLAEDSTLKELRKSEVDLEQTLERRKIDLRPGHPEYESTVGELAKVREKIQERISLLLGKLQNEYKLAVAQERYLLDQIAAEEGTSLDVAMFKSENNMAKSESEVTERIFELIAATMNEVQVGLNLMNNNVALLDEATPPQSPIRPRRRVNLMIGAFLGLFLGVAVAFFIDYLDNTFRSPDDVEKYLGLSVLGLIPKIQQQDLADRVVKEAYQSLRTSVIFSSKNHRRRVILVTSTSPQEGKSSTVANLGRMLAAAGDRVVIIDCDLRRPAQHLIHELEREPGVTNHLAARLETDPLDGSGWTRYARQVEANLELIASGPIPPSPPELLGSERFLQFIGSLREKYDWVLIDSPPAATLADATLLASVADMVMLVIRHAQTDRDLVRKTLQRLRGVNANVAGAVLNNVDIERAYHKDYYYAGAYYYTDDSHPRSRKKRKLESKVNVG